MSRTRIQYRYQLTKAGAAAIRDLATALSQMILDPSQTNKQAAQKTLDQHEPTILNLIDPTIKTPDISPTHPR